MRKFILKFTIVLALFFIPAGYFKFIVSPNISGDIGRIGMIPFGIENKDLNVIGYSRDYLGRSNVIDVISPDSLGIYKIITIGDSFSQQDEFGYQQKLSALTECTVANYKTDIGFSVADNYLMLLNNGYLKAGQTIILESVERALIGCFSEADFNAEFKRSGKIDYSEYAYNDSFLPRYFSYIRLRMGIMNPIESFSLSQQAFSSPKRYSNRLFVYNSPTIGDGDILWDRLPESKYKEASANMLSLISLSHLAGINLIIMVAADKYDAYEPIITEPHKINPTLTYLPSSPYIFNSCQLLRKFIIDGTKDIYKINDTHWSVVGADIIADALYDRYLSSRFLSE